MDRLRLGIIGAGGISGIFASALKSVAGAQITACASPNEGRSSAFARTFGIPKWYVDYHKMLESKEVDAVVIGTPNYLHAEMAVNSAKSGKHVFCVKPLCMNLREADEMISACAQARVQFMYGDNICFSPKYVRLRNLCQMGALGNVYFVKQTSKHGGPPTDWFWDSSKSGGWAIMDLACHAFQFFRWMYENTAVESILADIGNSVHLDKGKGDDHAVVLIDFKLGKKALAEVSWGKPGGFEDTAEAYGTKGVSYARMPLGMTLETFSEVGYQKSHYTQESVATGWSFCSYEEEWHYGFPQMLSHFVECVQHNERPLLAGEDGRAVLEMILAAYASAREAKRIHLPFRTLAKKPIDLWLEERR